MPAVTDSTDIDQQLADAIAAAERRTAAPQAPDSSASVDREFDRLLSLDQPSLAREQARYIRETPELPSVFGQVRQKLGQTVEKAGKLSVAIPADVMAKATGLEVEPWANVKAAVAGQPLPVEEAARELTGVGGVVSRLGAGALEMAPRIGLMETGIAAGLPAAVAAGGAFGLTKEGTIDPLRAAVAAGAPYVGAAGAELSRRGMEFLRSPAASEAVARTVNAPEEVVAKVIERYKKVSRLAEAATGGEAEAAQSALTRLQESYPGIARAIEREGRLPVGLDNETIQRGVQALGSQGLLGVYFTAASLPEVLSRPENERVSALEDAFIDNTLLSLMGIPIGLRAAQPLPERAFRERPSYATPEGQREEGPQQKRLGDVTQIRRDRYDRQYPPEEYGTRETDRERGGLLVGAPVAQAQIEAPATGITEAFQRRVFPLPGTTGPTLGVIPAQAPQRLALPPLAPEVESFQRLASTEEGKTPGQKSGQPKPVSTLKSGDIFNLRGQQFVVSSVDEQGNVTVTDGPTFGIQTLLADATFYPDKKSFIASPETPEAQAQLNNTLAAIEAQTQQYVQTTLSGFSAAAQDEARIYISDRVGREARKYLANKGTLEGFAIPTVVRSRAANWLRTQKGVVPTVSLAEPTGETRTLAETIPSEAAAPGAGMDVSNLVDQFKQSLSVQQRPALEQALASGDEAALAPFVEPLKTFLKSKGIGRSDVLGSIALRQASDVVRTSMRGLESVRTYVNSPQFPFDQRTKDLWNALLDSPALRDSRLKDISVTVGGTGDFQGLADISNWLVTIGSNADATTFPHEVSHLLYELLPQNVRDQLEALRKDAIRDKYGDKAPMGLSVGMTSDQFLALEKPTGLGTALPREDYHLSNASEFLAHFFSNDFAKTQFANRNKGRWEQLRTKIIDWLKNLWSSIRGAFGARPDINQIVRDILRGKYVNNPESGQRAEARYGSLTQALKQREAIAAEEPARAETAIRLGQAGEVVGQAGVAQEAVARLQAIAASEPTNSAERFERDAARDALRTPEIKGGVLESVASVIEAAKLMGDSVKSVQDLERTGASAEMVSAAVGNAFENVHKFYTEKQKFAVRYSTERAAALENIASYFEPEVEAMAKLDVSTVLFSRIKDLGSLALRTAQSSAAEKATDTAAYRLVIQAEPAVKNVLRWVSDNVDLSVVRAGGITTIEGLINHITNAARPMFTPEKNTLEQVLGASDEVIRAVSRIVLLSEPIRNDLAAARRLAAGAKFAEPFNKITAKLGEAIGKGNYGQALDIYTRGIIATGIEQREARDAINFYARKTRQELVHIRGLDHGNEMLNRIAADPSFRTTGQYIYDRLNVRDILYDNKGSTIRFAQVNPEDPPVELRMGNSREDWLYNQQALQNLAVSYNDYISNPDRPDYDPKRANGMMRALQQILEFQLNLENDPRNERLIPDAERIRKRITPSWLGQQLAIGQFALDQAAGMAAQYARTALSAEVAVTEQTHRMLAKHEAARKLAAVAAAEAHNLDPETYRDEVWVPMVSTRQNFNDAVVLKEGDAIGNGQRVLPEDLAYLKVWRDFEQDLIDTVNNLGKVKYKAVSLLPQGILFDNNKALRLPFHHGPDTTSRYWPSQAAEWATKWNQASVAGKIDMLDKRIGRFLIGYINGTGQADWNSKFTYAFPAETVEVRREMKTKPILGFDDLAERIYQLRLENEEVEPPTLDDVKAALLDDFDLIWKRVTRFVKESEGEIKPEMTSLSIMGGKSSFNTPRSEVYMPPGWYDYGGVTESDYVVHAKKAEVPFVLGYRHSLETLKTALQSIVDDFVQDLAKNAEIGSKSVQAARRGEIYYSHGQAVRALNVVSQELANVTGYLESKDAVVTSERPYETRYRGMTGFIMSSILGSASAFINNLGGGALQASLTRSHVLGTGIVRSLAIEARHRIPLAMRELVYLAASDKSAMGKYNHRLLTSVKSAPIIGQLADMLLHYADLQAQFHEHLREQGLHLIYPLRAQLEAMRKTAVMGGRVQERAPLTRTGKVANILSAYTQGAARFVGAAGINYADSLINMGAIADSFDYLNDLISTAQKWGPIIEEAAIREGRDPWNWQDQKNRFPDEALGEHSLTDKKSAAARKRAFFNNRALINIDKAMLDYYRRWKMRGEGEEVPMLTPEEMNQLVLAIAGESNLATAANRPRWARSGAFNAFFSRLLQYPNWALQKFESLTNQLSSMHWAAGMVKNLPHLWKLAVITALISVGVLTLRQEVNRLMNKEPAFPTIFEATSLKQAGITTLSAMADQIPFYGSAINMALNRGYNTGYDLNNIFVGLNMGRDALNMARQVFETRDFIRPAERFATRWIAPFNMIGQFLPNQSGLREMTNTRNILASGARSTNIEGKLRKPQAGAGGDMVLTPASPIIDDAVNAIGRQDMAGFQTAFRKLVEYRRSSGDPDPEKGALRAIESRNPLRTIFGKKPTQEELNSIFANLGPARAARAARTLNFYDQAIASVTPAKTTRVPRGTAAGRRVSLRGRGGRAPGFGRRRPVRLRSLRLARARTKLPSQRRKKLVIPEV